MRTWIGGTGAMAALLLSLAAPSRVAAQQDFTWDEAHSGPLPRWREGGTPEADPNQPLQPFALDLSGVEMPPTSGVIASPPEYDPADGVLFRYSAGSWPAVVTECVAKLTGDPAHDEIAYVVVQNAAQQNSATAAFSAAGADLSKVQFITLPTDSIWLRDYGPHFVWQSGALAIADSHYYPTRPQDNFIPTLLAEDVLQIPPYAMGLYYSGGNFQPGPNRSGFVTSLVQQDNPEMTLSEIAGLYRTYQGIDTLHVFPRLPASVDGTGHIDMWMYLVDADDVIISRFLPGSNATAIQITENAVPYMQNLGFTVHRVPAWNKGYTHYTYTNAFRVNDRIFVPIYGKGNPAYLDEDQRALQAWTEAAGSGVTIVPIDCYSIIPAAGAIHCIVMQVPRYTASMPSAHVLSPDGGELLVWKNQHDLSWAASDDTGVTSVDLDLSTDGGQTFPYPIATGEPNDGHFAWTVPYAPTPKGVVRVTAHDADGNAVAAQSAGTFVIRPLRQRTYDFSSGAGADKWVWGFDTASWADLDGVRYPASVSTELGPAEYAKLAVSDATGGDSDPNRYVSPTPTGGRESTHVVEFQLQESAACLFDVEILWEGYGDQCEQMELYVWDDVAGNWCDAAGGFGLNAYAANFAGNRDETLEVHLRKDFNRYVDASGRLTLLLLSDRPGQETFHDYVAVRTSYRACP